MLLGDIPIFSMLKQRMHWLSERQTVLAENVANADTPKYVARDLKELDFNRMVAEGQGRLYTVQTHAAHIAKASVSPERSGRVAKRPDFETTPTGNAVVLEEQMMKVAGTQMDYEMASGLYSKSLGLLKSALGVNR